MNSDKTRKSIVRKMMITLMLAASFALGMVTISFALGYVETADWIAPKYGEKAPTLEGSFNCPGTPGRMFYQLPDGWKIIGLGKSNLGNPVIDYRKFKAE